MTRRLALAAAALAALSVSAPAQQAQQQVPPASWWADNPAARARVGALCREYPGEAARSDYCAAVHQGNAIAAEREARAVTGDRSRPSTIEYWDKRPEERAYYVLTCSRVAPEQAERMWCPQAREAQRRADEAARRAAEAAQRADQPAQDRRTQRPPRRS